MWSQLTNSKHSAVISWNCGQTSWVMTLCWFGMVARRWADDHCHVIGLEIPFFYWRLHQPFLWSYQNLLTKSLNICFGIKSFNVLSMVELLNVSHHGLCQAPFNATHYNTAMATDRVDKKVYKCGQNWWRHNLIWSPNPGAARLIIFGATWWYGGWKKSCTS
jgi:hypothetical protein